MVHPNNPTGHFTKPWEAEELARICRAHELSLIVDEVFLDYGMGAATESNREKARTGAGLAPQETKTVSWGPRLETRTTAGLETGATKETGAARVRSEAAGSFAAGLEGVPVFVVSGLSKIAGLPQMKAAWIAATGPEKAQALERLVGAAGLAWR